MLVLVEIFDKLLAFVERLNTLLSFFVKLVKLLAFLVILETLFAFLVIESPSTKFPIRLSILTVVIFSISSSSFFSSLLFSLFVIVEDIFISACGFVSKNEIEVT